MKWLQFNDFHIGDDRAPDREVLASLLEKVKAMLEDGEAPVDAVFLVGDIAYSGNPKEYLTFAQHFLTPLKAISGVVDSNFLIVPGNHDVKCDESTPITWETIGPRNQRTYFSEDSAGIKARKARAPTFDVYSEFAAKHDLIGPI